MTMWHRGVDVGRSRQLSFVRGVILERPAEELEKIYCACRLRIIRPTGEEELLTAGKMAFLGAMKDLDGITGAFLKVAGDVEKAGRITGWVQVLNIYIGVTLYKREFLKGIRGSCPS